uniref:MARVEL domain-containing protein n=1 Tax=Plectus sambesii TaxID=2011161 RepID=A0A914XF53_9BILA
MLFIQLMLTYPKTYHGLAKAVQIVAGLIANICLGWSFYWIGYFVQDIIAVVLILTLFINIFQFLFHFLNLNKAWTTIDWKRPETIYAIVGVVLTFVCMIFESIYAFNLPWSVRWIFTAIFGWILCGAFGVEAFLFLTGRVED